MKRRSLGGSLALCVLLVATVSRAADIGSGHYDTPISGPAILSGTIDLSVAQTAGWPYAALITRNGPITGVVNLLTIRATDMSGIVASQDSIQLSGPVDITVSGFNEQGVLADGPRAHLGLDGPLTVRTSGDYSHAVQNRDAVGGNFGLDLSGPTRLITTGDKAFGVYLFGGTTRLGEISIATTGAASSAIYTLGGKLTLDGPVTIRTAGPDAFALQIQGDIPYTGNEVTTRLIAGVPNPQRLDIEGPIRVYGTGNRLELDLGEGSHLNSRILDANQNGAVSLIFHSHNAQWTTGLGSVVHNGARLDLDFTNGGVWNLPATDATNAALPSPVVPLLVQDTGQFTVTGADSLRVLPATSLSAGESASYVLVQAQTALPADLTAMQALSGNLLYRADGLSADAVKGLPTLEATITRLKTSEALPNLSPDTGGLLPDGGGSQGSGGTGGSGGAGNTGGSSAPGRPDDGAGNPFLSLALAQHLNGLSLDEITSALEGAPALTRAVPVASLTRNLEQRIRQSSPIGGVHGHGPRRVALDGGTDGAASTRLWLAPLYMHEEESVPRSSGPDTRYRADLGGALAGLERKAGAWTVGGGLSAGGGHTVSSGHTLPRTSGQVRYAGALAYGLWEKNDWTLGLEGNALRTWSSLSQRNPVMPLKASVLVDGLGVEAVVSRRFIQDLWRIEPNAGLEFSHFKQHRHTVRGLLRNGSEADLFVNGAVRQNVWRTPVGLKISRELWIDSSGAEWLLLPEGHVRYIPVLGKTGAALPVWRADAPDIRVVMAGAGLDRHTLETGLGLDAWRGPVRLALDYMWQHSTHRNAHFVSGTVGYAF